MQDSLQMYTKIVDFELDPGQICQEDWHIEGMFLPD